MNKQLLSIVLLLSSVASVRAHNTESNLVPAKDPRVLQAIVDHKEQLILKHIELLQKNSDQQSEIETLKATIEERAAQIAGRKIVGWSIGSAVVTGLVTYILSNLGKRSSNSSSSWPR